MAEINSKVHRLIRLTEDIVSTQARLSSLQEERVALMREIGAQFDEAAKAMEPESINERERQLGIDLASPIKLPPIPKGTWDGIKAAASLKRAAEAVAQLEGPVDANRLSKAMGISFDAARLRLARATKVGLLKRVAFGQYEAIPPEEGEGDIQF